MQPTISSLPALPGILPAEQMINIAKDIAVEASGCRILDWSLADNQVLCRMENGVHTVVYIQPGQAFCYKEDEEPIIKRL